MNDRGPTFDDEFEPAPEQIQLDTTGHGGDQQVLDAANSQSQRSTCGDDGCPQSNDIEVEMAWQNLMSAIPKERFAHSSNIAPEHAMSHAMPKPEDFERVIQSLRPDGCESFALDEVGNAWRTDVLTRLQDLPGLLQTYTAQLNEEWTGDDFDALESSIEETMKIAQEIIDSSDALAEQLEDASEQIFEAQTGNGGYVPFPAPQLWSTDDGGWPIVGWFKTEYVHCRPPWWSSGPCNRITPDYALQMVGFPPETIEQYNTTIDNETRRRQQENREWNQQVDETGGPLWLKRPDDWESIYIEVRDEYLTGNQEALASANEDYVQAAEDLNRDILDREYSANATYSTHQDPTELRQAALATDGEADLTDGLGGGLDGGLGDYGGMDSLPESSIDGSGLGDPGAWESNKNHSLPDADFNSGIGSGDGTPWSSSLVDTDDPNLGGLASGGAGGGLGGLGGGAGGGLGGGTGGGLGGGAGTGVGGMMGGAGGGHGTGPGSGGSRGAGGGGSKGMRSAGAGGGMMGGGGGGRGMGGAGETDEESSSWLTEDDDVWGIGNEDDDPYA